MKLQSRGVKVIARQNQFVDYQLIANTEEIQMKKINTGLLALALMSIGFAASANGVNNQTPRQHMGNHHNMVYSVAEQTTTPNETAKKLADAAPKIENGKRYVVKVSVVEVPEYSNSKNKPMPLPVKASADQ